MATDTLTPQQPKRPTWLQEEKDLEARFSVLRAIFFILFVMFGPLLPELEFFSPYFLTFSGLTTFYVVTVLFLLWVLDYYQHQMRFIFIFLDLAGATFIAYITNGLSNVFIFIYLPFLVVYGVLYRFKMSLYVNGLLIVFFAILSYLSSGFVISAIDWLNALSYLVPFMLLTFITAAISSYQWRRQVRFLVQYQQQNQELNQVKGELLTLRSTNRNLENELKSRVDELNREKESSEQQRLQAETRAWEIATIHNVAAAVNSTVILQEILQITVEKFARILQIERVDLIMFDQEDEFGYLRTFYGREGEQFRKIGTAIVEKSNPMVELMESLNRPIALEKTTRLRDEWILLRKLMRDSGFNALLLLPIKIKGEIVGIIQLNETKKEKIFSPQEISLCETLVEQVANAVERGLLVQETIEKTHALEKVNIQIEAEIHEKTISEARLARLSKVANTILSELDLNKVFDMVAESIVGYCGFNKCMISLLDKGNSKMVASAGLSQGEISGILSANRMSEKQRQMILSDVFRRSDSYFVPREVNLWVSNARVPEAASLNDLLTRTEWENGDELFVPLFDSENDLLGLISLDEPQDDKIPTEKRLEPVEAFAKQVVLSIEHVRIYDTLQAKLREIQENYDKLLEVEQLKSNFLSVISHELRTPLTSIKSFTEILIDEIENDDEADQSYLRFLNIIDQETDRLGSMITDILNLQELQEGRYVWSVEKLDLGRITRNVCRNFRTRLNEKNIELNVTIQEDLPPFMGDTRKLNDIFENLLSNALKFTPENGQVDVNVSVDDRDFIISVKDTGVGIPQEKLDVIFEKFQQADLSAKRRVGGAGLGLAIVKSVVEHYQGSYRVFSEVDKGSEFIIRLPRDFEAESQHGNTA